jgi:hypothetical protein
MASGRGCSWLTGCVLLGREYLTCRTAGLIAGRISSVVPGLALRRPKTAPPPS